LTVNPDQLEKILRDRDRELRVFHSWLLAAMMPPFCATVTGWQVFTMLGQHRMISPLGLGADILAAVVFAYNAFVYKTHSRLALWCKYCREDGWGDGGEEPIDPNGPPSGMKRGKRVLLHR
jgi:hypothetical protein